MHLRIARLLALSVAFWIAGFTPLVADIATDLARIGVEAAGGEKAHAALRSLRATGVTKVGDREVRFILHAERPNRLRMETLGESGTLVRAFDGIHVPWKKTDLLKPPVRLGPNEQRDFLLDADFDTPLLQPERRRISLDYAGEGVHEGRPCQKLLATIRFTNVVTLYLDEATRLVVRRDQTKKVRGKEVVIETHYSDFKPLKGVMLPRRIRTLVGKTLLNETVITDMDANPELPKNFFAPPAPDWPRL